MANQGQGTSFGDNTPTGVGAIEHFLTNYAGDWIFVRCSTANLPKGVPGYAVGCIIESTDNGGHYVNAGTVLSSNFLADSSILIFRTPVAINTSAVATPAQVVGGLITSTSAAAVNITLPTATALLAASGGGIGSTIDFYVDNSAGANTVTVVLDASETAPAGAITGGNTLTVTTVHKVGWFRLYFTTPTAAVIYRIS